MLGGAEAVITEKSAGWLKEYLRERCLTDVDRSNADEIIDTFRKLWTLAKACEENPYPRSPRLKEALAVIKKPDPVGRPGAGSL
jgi:hypothetical protein